jgi:hypothetical protein
MRPVRGMALGLVLVAASAFSTPARAAAVSVWFRTTDGCPNGEDFIERLSKHGVDGRLASVGDHIDFVVTLGQRDGESSATLERQSSEGTVALRELHGTSCDAVAEALALTLALTLDPDATPHAPSAADANQSAPTTSTSAASLTAEPAPVAPPVAPVAADHATSHPEAKRARWSTGLQATVGTVVRGAPLWGGVAFAELGATSGLKSAARLSLVGGVANDPIPNVRLTLFAGRLEACPLFVGASVGIGACAALELGSLGAASSASGGRSDANFWAALWGLARLRYLPAHSSFSAEIQGGISVPLTHYRLTGDVPPRTLAEVNTIGVGLAAGGAVSWQ